MKKTLCQYAIVRFLPYLETGEFANVGIVLMCPETGYFDFRLMTHVRRITAFFEELDAGIYRRARADFKKELTRIQDYLAPQTATRGFADAELARHLFAELTRPREVMMRFDGVRAILADDPKAKLNALFDHYVERNFVTREYQDRLLESTVRKLLFRAKVGTEYRQHKIGNADFAVNFPFVAMVEGRAERIIKPLYLAQGDSTKVLTHGGQWVDRVRRLRKRNALPDDVLFPVTAPIQNSRQFEAFEEIRDDLQSANVQVVSANDETRILQFVTRAGHLA